MIVHLTKIILVESQPLLLHDQVFGRDIYISYFRLRFLVDVDTPTSSMIIVNTPTVNELSPSN